MTTVVPNPCAQCTHDSKEADAQADAILCAQPDHADQPAAAHARLMASHEEYSRLRALALLRLDQARTHERTTNKLCPSYKPRQKVLTQQRMGEGVKLRLMTVKHGLQTLLRTDIPENDQAAILHAIGHVVHYNRCLVIHAMAFVRFYLTAILESGVHVPRALFSPAFFIGVFQLLAGDEWTNTKIFEGAQRDTLFYIFAQFRQSFPHIIMGKIPSSSGRPASRFSNITDYTAIELAASIKNHVVEDFAGFYISYLQGEMMRQHEELKPGHARAYAIYAYDRAANDEKFDAELPTPRLPQERKEALQATAESLATASEARWRQVHANIMEEKRRIAAATRIRQAQAQEMQRATLAERERRIRATTGQAEGPPVDEAILDQSDTGTMPGDVDASSEPASDVADTASVPGDMDATTTSRVSVTTASLTRHPHHFLKVMYEILQTMESWGDADEIQPAEPQESVTFPWVFRQLADNVTEWTRLNRRKRTRLTHLVSDLINKGDAIDPQRLPYNLSVASRFAIHHLGQDTIDRIHQGQFTPDTIIARSRVRLFTIAPVPALRFKFIHISHNALIQILRHFNLATYAIGPEAAPPDGEMHPVLEIFNWKKLRRPAGSAFENAFVTDAYSVGMLFKKAVPADRPPKLTLEDFDATDLDTCRFWGIDPGVTEVYVAVDGSSESHGIYNTLPPAMPCQLAHIRPVPGTEAWRPFDYYAAPISSCSVRCAEDPVRLPVRTPARPRSLSAPPRKSHPMALRLHNRHEIRRVSSAEFDRMTGRHITNRRINAMKQTPIGDQTVTNIESTISTAKTARIDRMTRHVRELLAALPRLLPFYGPHHQALRFLNYQGKQKATANMVNVLINGGNKYPRRDDDTISMRRSTDKPMR
ncbi:hypothetical protein BC940DRAFT_178544 [Gongronella butleri]|nr:hypothetical protein BC940DRAFT_178544 [Gongronella butleri]